MESVSVNCFLMVPPVVGPVPPVVKVRAAKLMLPGICSVVDNGIMNRLEQSSGQSGEIIGMIEVVADQELNSMPIPTPRMSNWTTQASKTHWTVSLVYGLIVATLSKQTPSGRSKTTYMQAS